MSADNNGPARGRPTLGTKPMRRHNFTLPDWVVEKAERVGNGNKSEGLRVMVEAFPEPKPPTP